MPLSMPAESVYDDVGLAALAQRLDWLGRRDALLDKRVLPRLADADRQCAQLLRAAAAEARKGDDALADAHADYATQRAAEHDDAAAFSRAPDADAPPSVAPARAAEQAMRSEQRRVKSATGADAKAARLGLRAAIRSRDAARLAAARAVAADELRRFEAGRSALLARLDADARALHRRAAQLAQLRGVVAALDARAEMDAFARRHACAEARSYSAALRVLDWDWARRRQPQPPPLEAPQARAFALLDGELDGEGPMDAEAAEAARLDAAESLAPAGLLALLSARRQRPDVSPRGPHAARALARLLCDVFTVAAARRDAAVGAQALALAGTFFRVGRDGSRIYVRDDAAFKPSLGDYAGFWDDALLVALKRDLDIRHDSTQSEPDDPWDFADTPVKDAVGFVHDLLFAAVAAVFVEMRQFGTSLDDVSRFLERAVDRAQLPRQQRLELYETFARLSAPPPAAQNECAGGGGAARDECERAPLDAPPPAAVRDDAPKIVNTSIM
ncbi:hypothetical protein M885DRAFT_588072, partial [Pelagophyceae sp. CCMP2097]